jgi:hypothetical protein
MSEFVLIAISRPVNRPEFLSFIEGAGQFAAATKGSAQASARAGS